MSDIQIKSSRIPIKIIIKHLVAVTGCITLDCQHCTASLSLLWSLHSSCHFLLLIIVHKERTLWPRVMCVGVKVSPSKQNTGQERRGHNVWQRCAGEVNLSLTIWIERLPSYKGNSYWTLQQYADWKWTHCTSKHGLVQLLYIAFYPIVPAIPAGHYIPVFLTECAGKSI